MVYERLILDATVLDNFSDELDELEERLDRVDRTFRDTLDDLEVDLDSDLDVSVDASDVDVDTGTGVSPSGGVADGGGGSSSMLDVDELIDAETQFGDAFDLEGFINRQGEVQRPIDLLDGSLTDFVDEDGIMDAIRRGDVDLDLLQNLGSMDADEAFDAFRELADRGLTDLPTEADSLTDQFLNMRLTMRPFFNIIAALIPVFANFVAALPAAIAGLASLATAAIAAIGALGAVGGLAILGMSLRDGEISVKPLERRITELFETFVDSFAPVANQLAPLAEETFSAVNRMFRELGTRADFLLSLTDEFRAGLGFLEDTLPSVLEGAARLGAAALPVLREFLGTATQIDFFGVMAEVMRETLPTILGIINAFGRMLPFIYRVSRGFLEVSASIIHLLTLFMKMINVVPGLAEGLGLLAGVTLTLVSATALYSLTQMQAVSASLSFMAAVLRKIPVIWTYIDALFVMIGVENAATAATITLGLAVATLIGLLTFGLVPILSGAASGFSLLAGDIGKATQSLKAFNSVAGRTSGMSVGGAVGTGASGQSVGYTDPSSITVVAPDEETGTSLANTLAFTNGETPTQNNVNGRVHRR